jgi:hypothetical protein
MKSTFNARLKALWELTVQEMEEHEWASPCFGVPKKNNTI